MELTLMRKSPLAPLFQGGVFPSLCQREGRRDFTDNVVTILRPLIKEAEFTLQ
jgi:hypothetical protein